MGNIIQKLTSRKMWFAIAGVATGVSMALGVNATEIQSIAGAVTMLISCVTFIIVEGKIDAERVKNTIIAVQDAVDTIQNGNVTVNEFGGDDNGAN